MNFGPIDRVGFRIERTDRENENELLKVQTLIDQRHVTLTTERRSPGSGGVDYIQATPKT